MLELYVENGVRSTDRSDRGHVQDANVARAQRNVTLWMHPSQMYQGVV
jgi:hypothetical protein